MMRGVFAISLVLVSDVLSGASKLSDSNTSANEIKAVLDAVNSIRTGKGLHALAHEEPASLAAILHAKELAERNLLSHRSLNGERVVERYRFAGGTGTMAGENLGAGDSIESILLAWMKSSSHSSNLLNSEWYNAGFGQVRTESGRIILVAIFSNSRWKNSSFEVSRGIAILSGELIYPEGIRPPTVFIRVGDNAINPAPMEPGAKQTKFSFPIPQSWRIGSMVPILFSVVESGVARQVDLLLLEVP